MQALFRSISLALLGFVLSCAAASAATVFFQGGCASGNNICTSVNSSTTFPRTLRSFTFNAPGPGRAHVAFHGSMLCSNAPNASFAIVDVITQINTLANATPIINQGGGLRHAETMFGTGFGVTSTFNLHSTREVTYGSGGPKTVYFRITNLRLDATITCSFYNMAFTVTYTP
jgi:hypothetical protein